MYSNYPYHPNNNEYGNRNYPTNPYVQQNYYNYDRNYSPNPAAPYAMERQAPVRGQATWTEGGQVTRCNIPWSQNDFMTVAVGTNTPYRCGETLKIRNLSSPDQKDIDVLIVDQVAEYPPNKINLHRTAFEALGANLNQGIINVEIIPTAPPVQEEAWATYLLGLTQMAYPGYTLTNFQAVEKTEVSPQETKETYDFNLQSPQEEITVRGNIVYNPNTNRVISFDIKEV